MPIFDYFSLVIALNFLCKYINKAKLVLGLTLLFMFSWVFAILFAL